jgi:hypothetical protein
MPSRQVEAVQTKPEAGLLVQDPPDTNSTSQSPASIAFAIIEDTSQAPP